jgi:hypothetical protein
MAFTCYPKTCVTAENATDFGNFRKLVNGLVAAVRPRDLN